jgi:capsule polysaccharide export protein KpsE/RkpR
LLTRRRIRLEQLYEGKNDAFADKEIDAIQRRIDDSQADMDDYRRRYGI